jgi:hypothetical protein
MHDQSAGRYEVAVDAGLELRRYRDFPRVGRLRTMAASTDPVSVLFDGSRFAWHPATDELLAVVTTPIASADDYREERRATLHFLSALSFEFGVPIRVFTEAASGFKQELDPPLLQQPRLKGTIFPAPSEVLVEEDSDLRLCLALMREGISAHTEAVRYLSLFKALEAALGEGQVDAWIDEPSRMKDVAPEGGWAAHLREARNAAAHASRRDPTARSYDPDDPETFGLQEDAGRVWILARQAILERWPQGVRSLE